MVQLFLVQMKDTVFFLRLSNKDQASLSRDNKNEVGIKIRNPIFDEQKPSFPLRVLLFLSALCVSFLRKKAVFRNRTGDLMITRAT